MGFANVKKAWSSKITNAFAHQAILKLMMIAKDVEVYA